MARNITFIPEEFYHIYNRGTDKRKIFLTKSDYERFLALLYISNGSIPVHLQLQGRTLTEARETDRGKPLVDIISYCLMPNHFHLLIRETKKGNISRFMQKLITGYTMYFNTRHERSGVLFQGRFKAKHVYNEKYFSYLIAYIHLNPTALLSSLDVKQDEAGAALSNKHICVNKKLKTYRYSSYLDHAGQERPEKIILNTDVFLERVGTPTDFKEIISHFKAGP